MASKTANCIVNSLSLDGSLNFDINLIDFSNFDILFDAFFGAFPNFLKIDFLLKIPTKGIGAAFDLMIPALEGKFPNFSFDLGSLGKLEFTKGIDIDISLFDPKAFLKLFEFLLQIPLKLPSLMLDKKTMTLNFNIDIPKLIKSLGFDIPDLSAININFPGAFITCFITAITGIFSSSKENSENDDKKFAQEAKKLYNEGDAKGAKKILKNNFITEEKYENSLNKKPFFTSEITDSGELIIVIEN